MLSSACPRPPVRPSKPRYLRRSKTNPVEPVNSAKNSLLGVCSLQISVLIRVHRRATRGSGVTSKVSIHAAYPVNSNSFLALAVQSIEARDSGPTPWHHFSCPTPNLADTRFPLAIRINFQLIQIVCDRVRRFGRRAFQWLPGRVRGRP